MHIKHSKRKNKKGFTLVELMVVVAIMAIVTSVVLFNNRDLNSSLLVSNTAYEINLLIREVQTYGLGVVGTDNTSAGFAYGQGVHFDMVTPDQVISFADKDGNKAYSGETENIQIYKLNTERGGSLLSICTPGASGVCTPLGSGTSVDVVFKRPNPEASFTESGVEVDGPVVVNLGFSTNRMCRSIIIQKTGSVQINQQYCI